MPRPLSPAELRAAAATARREAKQARARAELEALALEQLAAELEDAAARGLTITSDRAIVRRKMQGAANADPRTLRKVGRPIERDHAFPCALKRANVTMVEYARKLGKNRSTVKSWLDRPIPEAMAKFIENDLGVPATAASWPAGIK